MTKAIARPSYVQPSRQRAGSPFLSRNGLARFLPGLSFCALVTLLAYALAAVEAWLFGREWLEPLVLAILIGTTIRSLWTPSTLWLPGINLSAKLLLEIAVVLLGLSVSAARIFAAGPWLLLGIMAIVAAAIICSFTIGRVLGLQKRLAMLIACGNSICGNSAIAAVAPVIGADGDDVAASIAFTAVLGVIVVLVLPLIGIALHLGQIKYGILAGLTVYAVPQVLAASAPMGTTALHMGTLVKLVRVLMLGPVTLILSLVAPHLRPESGETNHPAARRPPIHQLVPWFIIGFLTLMILRSVGWVPTALLAPAGFAATLLTVLSMAALGLGVDVRTVVRAGGRVTVAVIFSLLVLGGISLLLIFALNPA